ncbi:MAG TPA: nitrilase-related carbon-nitrogen hydrolase, partial [Gallionella sp.]|nr:nitrilase-related carbon-nitrogen hydrolase [Gallionella sp.]
MEPLNITMAQLDFRICDFARNVGMINAVIRANASSDLIVFSELALSGYYPQDMLDEPAFIERQDAALAEILAASRHTGAAIVLGAVTRNAGVGKPFHNSLLVIRDGKVLLSYQKQLLPTYNIFDEQRHFAPGENRAAVFTLKERRIGFLICEDGWNDEELDYEVNPFSTLTEASVDLIVSINASPSDVGKQRQRHGIFGSASKRHGVPLLYVNQVGGNDQLVFDGGSFVVDPQAGVVHEMPLFEEAVEQVSFDGAFFNARGRLDSPVRDYLADEEFYYRQIVLGLRDYLEKTGFKSVVVGSSGGIDSALTLALACD